MRSKRVAGDGGLGHREYADGSPNVPLGIVEITVEKMPSDPA